MNTRTTPTGHQHYLNVRLRHAPESRHTNPLNVLTGLEDGLEAKHLGAFLGWCSCHSSNEGRPLVEVVWDSACS